MQWKCAAKQCCFNKRQIQNYNVNQLWNDWKLEYEVFEAWQWITVHIRIFYFKQ